MFSKYNMHFKMQMKEFELLHISKPVSHQCDNWTPLHSFVNNTTSATNILLLWSNFRNTIGKHTVKLFITTPLFIHATAVWM